MSTENILEEIKKILEERIRRNKTYIDNSIELIQTEKRPLEVIVTLTDEIKRTQIRVSELQEILRILSSLPNQES